MHEVIKRRLVGAVILLSLMSILMIWAVSNQSGVNNFIWLAPVPPDFQQIAIDEQIKPPELEDIQQRLDDLKNNLVALNDNDPEPEGKQKEPAKQIAAKAAEAATPPADNQQGKPANPLDEIAFNENSIPTRWVVQASSFADEDSAIKEKKRLAANDFVAVVRASRSSKSGSIIYAVYVGPFLQQSKAEENHKLLKQKLRIEGTIRKWQ